MQLSSIACSNIKLNKRKNGHFKPINQIELSRNRHTEQISIWDFPKHTFLQSWKINSNQFVQWKQRRRHKKRSKKTYCQSFSCHESFTCLHRFSVRHTNRRNGTKSSLFVLWWIETVQKKKNAEEHSTQKNWKNGHHLKDTCSKFLAVD